jgi:hypothetical protein
MALTTMMTTTAMTSSMYEHEPPDRGAIMDRDWASKQIL